MSYQTQQAVMQQEQLLNAWQINLNNIEVGDGWVEVYKGPVTGLSHHNYKKVCEHLHVGHILLVNRDKMNPYDVNATGLFYSGYQVGWVPKAMNSVVAQAVDQGHILEARIIRHKEFCGDYSNILFVEIYTKSLRSSKHINHTQLTKETEMKPAKAVVEQNISLASSAAFLEAGRIANNQLSTIASKKLPIMVRAYADTAMGRLLLANIALMARDHFRPNDERLGKLVNAMTVNAYQEVLQNFDIEQMIEDMVNNKTIAKALKSIDKVEERTTE